MMVSGSGSFSVFVGTGELPFCRSFARPFPNPSSKLSPESPDNPLTGDGEKVVDSAAVILSR